MIEFAANYGQSLDDPTIRRLYAIGRDDRDPVVRVARSRASSCRRVNDPVTFAAAVAEATSPQDNHIARLLRLDQANDVARDGRHDPSVFRLVAVAVVNVRHRTGLVIGDPVHRVAAKAESSDRGQAGSPEIMWCGALDP